MHNAINCLKSLGFSLLELLIAIALSTLVLTALITIYLSVRNTYQTQNQLDAFQENLRFVSSVLQKSINMAGYAGCRRLNEINLTNHTKFNFSIKSSVVGYDTQHLPGYLRGLVLSNTDVLIVKHTANDVTRVIAPVLVGANSVKVIQNPANKDNLFLFIADCTNAELFPARNWVGNTIMTDTPFNNSYGVGVSEVGRYEEIAYFVGDSGRVDAKGQHIISLYELINQGNKQEIISGVTSLQISYGVSEAGGKTITKYYSTAEMQSLMLWSEVRCVKISLEFILSTGSKRINFCIQLKER